MPTLSKQIVKEIAVVDTEVIVPEEQQPSSPIHLKNLLFLVNQLLKVSNLSSGLDKFLSNSIFSAFMMSNLINDLLDLAKLQNSAFELNMERFNLV